MERFGDESRWHVAEGYFPPLCRSGVDLSREIGFAYIPPTKALRFGVFDGAE